MGVEADIVVSPDQPRGILAGCDTYGIGCSLLRVEASGKLERLLPPYSSRVSEESGKLPGS